jgi:enoyl-CoA hydratase/carnithine racemase
MSMAYEFATYEKHGRLAIVTLNRPERLNALHPPAHFELHEIWNDFERDPEVWVGILTGAGDKAFSAGNDLKYTAEHGTNMGRAAESGFGGITNRTACWKPIIAAVNGFALGGGFEMALACDLIIAADHARLGLPEPRVGLMAGAGGVHRLPRMIPHKIALGYILTGRHMTAQEAHRWGIVNEVVPLADLMSTVHKWANDILACAPLSIRASKQAALMGLGQPLEIALSLNYTEALKMRHSEDTVEGPRAFAEKRPPRWQGR